MSLAGRGQQWVTGAGQVCGGSLVRVPPQLSMFMPTCTNVHTSESPQVSLLEAAMYFQPLGDVEIPWVCFSLIPW